MTTFENPDPTIRFNIAPDIQAALAKRPEALKKVVAGMADEISEYCDSWQTPTETGAAGCGLSATLVEDSAGVEATLSCETPTCSYQRLCTNFAGRMLLREINNAANRR